MLKLKYLLLTSVVTVVSNNVLAAEIKLTFDDAGSPLVNSHTTHTPTELKPISSFNMDNAVKLATVCSITGGCNGISFDKSGNSTGLDTPAQCKDEGFAQSCPPGQVKDINNICPYNPSYFKCRKADDTCKSGYSPTECSEEMTLVDSYQNEAGNTCYQCFEKPDDVKCEEKGFVKVCPDGQVKDENNTCPYNPAYFKCRPAKNTCDTNYSLNECNQDQVSVDSYQNEAGNTCYQCMEKPDDVKCEEKGFVKACPDGQVKDEKNLCPDNSAYFKCREAKNTCDNGYALTACSSEQIQTDSYTNEAGNTCYTCRDKTCMEGGYKDSVTSCQKGTSVSFANKTCYKDVSDKSCEDLGYLSSVPANNQCTPVAKCNKNCYSECKQPDCKDGGFLASCPDNHVCTSTTYYGRKCYTDGGQPTCEDGGYKSGIPANQVCSQTTYYGRKCFEDCYQPTCDNGGYKDAVPSGQSCTSVTYYGRNCFKDCKTTITTLPILYSDKTVSASIISGKTPIGVVFDSNRRLAVALNQSSTTFGGYETEITNLENCYIGRDMTSCGSDGKTNTAKIIQAGKENNISYPAAEYCYKYTTAGTKVGDWFLPSVNELKNICDVKENINATLNLLGKSPLTPEGKSYWSSTGYSNFYSWTFYLAVCSAGDNQNHRGTNLSVRPIIQY